MKCPSCQKEVPDDMAICGYCGGSLKSAPAAAASPMKGPEEDVWKGRYSWRAMAGSWILYALWLALLGFVCFNPSVWKEIQSKEWLGYVAAGLAALPMLPIVAKMFHRKLSLSYRLTTRRLFIKRGILLQVSDETDLMRVDDVQKRQSLFQRLFNVGTLIVVAPTDKTDSELLMEGIADPETVKEKIKEQVWRNKERSVRMEQI